MLARLERACDVEVADRDLTPDDLKGAVRGKVGLVSLMIDRIDRDVIDAGSDLRVIANVAVGYDNIDVDYARSRGVVVTNTPDVLTESVAEFTWGLILAVTRRIAEGDRYIRADRWKAWSFDFMLGAGLRDKQLGILGLGRIGRAVAARAPAFGMRVAYASHRPAGDTSDAGGAGGPTRLSFDELLVSSDVVSLHLPLRPETRHLIDQRALARMKRSAYLVNTSRGPIVDETALVWALGERLIAGAALDVFEREPAVHPGLPPFENVVLVPHLGSAARETRTAMADLAARNVVAVLTGQPALTPVSPAPGPDEGDR